MKIFLFLDAICLFLNGFLSAQEPKPLSIVIMGYGGRAQWLLMKCLAEQSNIVVAAICDDNAQECLNHMFRECDGYYADLKKIYNSAMSQVELYPDSPEGLSTMLNQHGDVDMIWITSRNDRHLDHLTYALQLSPHSKIFMEKPLFRTLEELRAFDWSLTNDRDIVIGLTLRYSSMAKIVTQQLQTYKEDLGPLQKVKAWERLSFPHALGSFVMTNRRYRSLWGGLLLEKSIHDIDLALFFVSSLGLYPSRIILDTVIQNQFFTQSNQEKVLQFCGDKEHKIRVKEVLSNYPATGKFYEDFIPDYHMLSARFFSEGCNPIQFEVETDMSSYRSVMERGTLLTFEQGQVLVDVMASCMTINLNDGKCFTYDLNTLYGGHADGDMYVVQAILNKTTSNNHFQATITDPVVQLANIIALVSEKQAIYKQGTQEISYKNNSWVLESK